ncbi:DUF1934 domain-containing protein [Butyrivibrio sp. AE3004]|uniref:DUF1934 domain-containing protein n=1 Tax=Butyrivibrio sp. AE3004 TaxID=1506994 RepID=UPI00049417FF|nr:DUF1934 domain-containing protein [Butyrivibrio sp. AE3004]
MNGTVKIIGAHDHGDGKPQIIKNLQNAFCEQDGLNYIITYTDRMDSEDDHRSGSPKASSVTTHRLEIGEGYLRMVQTGDINSDLLFRLGEAWDTDYQTPYGLMKMTAITRNLMVEISPKKITAHVQYELQMDGDKISDSKVRISFTFE